MPVEDADGETMEIVCKGLLVVCDGRMDDAKNLEEVVLFEEAGMGRGDETSDTFMGPSLLMFRRRPLPTSLAATIECGRN